MRLTETMPEAACSLSKSPSSLEKAYSASDLGFFQALNDLNGAAPGARLPYQAPRGKSFRAYGHVGALLCVWVPSSTMAPVTAGVTPSLLYPVKAPVASVILRRLHRTQKSFLSKSANELAGNTWSSAT